VWAADGPRVRQGRRRPARRQVAAPAAWLAAVAVALLVAVPGHALADDEAAPLVEFGLLSIADGCTDSGCGGVISRSEMEVWVVAVLIDARRVALQSHAD